MFCVAPLRQCGDRKGAVTRYRSRCCWASGSGRLVPISARSSTITSAASRLPLVRYRDVEDDDAALLEWSTADERLSQSQVVGLIDIDRLLVLVVLSKDVVVRRRIRVVTVVGGDLGYVRPGKFPGRSRQSCS